MLLSALCQLLSLQCLGGRVTTVSFTASLCKGRYYTGCTAPCSILRSKDSLPNDRILFLLTFYGFSSLFSFISVVIG